MGILRIELSAAAMQWGCVDSRTYIRDLLEWVPAQQDSRTAELLHHCVSA
jgi:hypothetical protein